MSKRSTRPHSPDSSPLLSETADVERGARRGGLSAPEEAKPWDVVPPPSVARKGQGSRVFRTIMLVLIAILALLLLGVRNVICCTSRSLLNHPSVVLFARRVATVTGAIAFVSAGSWFAEAAAPHACYCSKGSHYIALTLHIAPRGEMTSNMRPLLSAYCALNI